MKKFFTYFDCLEIGINFLIYTAQSSGQIYRSIGKWKLETNPTKVGREPIMAANLG
jgi:hypothetical protein